MVAETQSLVGTGSQSRVTAQGAALRLVVWCLLVLGAVAWEQASQSNSRYAATATIYAIVALSLNILVGYTGQLSLGHQGFVGAGAMITGWFATTHGLPLPIALCGGVLVGALFALLLGVVALRITGLYLSLVTLVFGLTLADSFFLVSSLGGGAARNVNRPALLLSNHRYLLVCLGVLALVLYLDVQLMRSKVGRALLSIKENERVAQAFGVQVTAYKLLAFVISGGIAGLAGGLYAFNSQQFNGSVYDFTMALTFVIMTVVGGAGSRWGVVVGGMLFALLKPLLTSLFKLDAISGLLGHLGPIGANQQFLPDLVGVVLLLLTLVQFPGGLAQQFGWFGRWLAFKPFSLHDPDRDSGPGAVEGSSVRA